MHFPLRQPRQERKSLCTAKPPANIVLPSIRDASWFLREDASLKFSCHSRPTAFGSITGNKFQRLLFFATPALECPDADPASVRTGTTLPRPRQNRTFLQNSLLLLEGQWASSSWFERINTLTGSDGGESAVTRTRVPWLCRPRNPSSSRYGLLRPAGLPRFAPYSPQTFFIFRKIVVLSRPSRLAASPTEPKWAMARSR